MTVEGIEGRAPRVHLAFTAGTLTLHGTSVRLAAPLLALRGAANALHVSGVHRELVLVERVEWRDLAGISAPLPADLAEVVRAPPTGRVEGVLNPELFFFFFPCCS